MAYYIGVDLGGTNVKAGVLDENCNVLGRGSVLTDLPKTPDEVAELVKKSIEMALNEASITLNQIKWIGLGVPGITDAAKGIINFSSNLGFRNVPIAEMLQKLLGLPVYIENDANAAIYGEVLNGSAKGFKNALMLTLGTGVGGGIVIDGHIYSGFNSQGAELGHVGMVYGGEPCPCGHTGCIEMYCSASALIRQTKKAMAEDKNSLLWEIVQGDIEKVDGKTAFDGAKKGDKTAESVVRQYVDYLSYGLANYINIFQPEIIVLAGGVSGQGEVLLAPIRAYVKKYALGYAEDAHTKIETAKLGNDAGIIGAAFLGQMHA